MFCLKFVFWKVNWCLLKCCVLYRIIFISNQPNSRREDLFGIPKQPICATQSSNNHHPSSLPTKLGLANRTKVKMDQMANKGQGQVKKTDEDQDKAGTQNVRRNVFLRSLTFFNYSICLFFNFKKTQFKKPKFPMFSLRILWVFQEHVFTFLR